MICPGWWEARTGDGELDRYRAERIVGGDQGYGERSEWFLTYPGEHAPDSVADTLAQVKAFAQASANNVA
jgi:hypothetical protein